MKTKLNMTSITRSTLLAAAACGFVSCASVEHPLTRHDMDGDGAISHAEYQQNHMQYDMASRQRSDEYSRARLATAHMDNVGDFIGEASQATYMLRNFSH